MTHHFPVVIIVQNGKTQMPHDKLCEYLRGLVRPTLDRPVEDDVE